MAPLVAYWDVRGRVTAIRLLLSYEGIPFDYKEYKVEDYEKWPQQKLDLQETLDFPNLPYYIDDDVKLTHTITILEYLGRKYGLDGKEETEKIRMSLAIQQMADLHQFFIDIGKLSMMTFIPNRAEICETLRKQYLESIPARLEQFAKFLGSNTCVAGNNLTYADFRVYDILDYHRIFFSPKNFNNFPTLVEYMARFEALKGVKEFVATWDRLPGPSWAYDVILKKDDLKK